MNARQSTPCIASFMATHEAAVKTRGVVRHAHLAEFVREPNCGRNERTGAGIDAVDSEARQSADRDCGHGHSVQR